MCECIREGPGFTRPNFQMRRLGRDRDMILPQLTCAHVQTIIKEGAQPARLSTGICTMPDIHLDYMPNITNRTTKQDIRIN